jgi:hypothetical protein
VASGTGQEIDPRVDRARSEDGQQGSLHRPYTVGGPSPCNRRASQRRGFDELTQRFYPKRYDGLWGDN